MQVSAAIRGWKTTNQAENVLPFFVYPNTSTLYLYTVFASCHIPNSLNANRSSEFFCGVLA